jgi:arsenate reductase
MKATMPKVTIYGLKNCDSCRKALKDLAAGHTDATLIDIRQQPLTRDTISEFYAIFGDDLVIKKSKTWRELSETDKLTAPIDQLQKFPPLMK